MKQNFILTSLDHFLFLQKFSHYPKFDIDASSFYFEFLQGVYEKTGHSNIFSYLTFDFKISTIVQQNDVFL